MPLKLKYLFLLVGRRMICFPELQSAILQRQWAHHIIATIDDHVTKQKSSSDYFSNWVFAGDRRVLRSPGISVRAHIVVVQDGSGNYNTIFEGLAAAKRRERLEGQEVCHMYVKKGVYRENVEIEKSMKNLMFIGDETVLIGDINVVDGDINLTFGEILIT